LIAWKFLDTALKDLIGYKKRLTPKGRLHTSYRQTLVTGRTSSSDPNLMKIPKQQGRISEVDVGSAELAKTCANAFKKVRSVILADPQGVIVCCDYDQGEYRAFTFYSGSQRLIDRIKAGEDFHEIVCKLVFGDHTPRLRHVVKIVNFGLIYGMGEALLKTTIKAGDPNIDPTDVLSKYKKFLPEMKDTQKRIMEKGKARGYVVDVFGRRYHYQQNAPHKLVSYICQGTVAGMKKRSMARLGPLLQNTQSRVGLDIHDELDFMMFERDAELFRQFKPIMEDFPEFKGIPITTDCKAGFDLLNTRKMTQDETVEFIKTHGFASSKQRRQLIIH
jgi:DNA polymerase-1